MDRRPFLPEMAEPAPPIGPTYLVNKIREVPNFFRKMSTIIFG